MVQRIGAAALVAGVVALMWPAAAAAKDSDTAGSAAVREGFSMATTFDEQDRPSFTPGPATSAVTEASGKVRSAKVATPARFEQNARTSEAYSCVNNRGRRGFTAYPPRARSMSTDALYIRFVYHYYKQNGARQLGPRNRRFATKQLEGCTTGGASARGGNKLRRVVTGMTMASRADRLIGQKWGRGKDKATAKANLSFAVPVRAVTITGSVDVHPEDTFTGSQGPDKQAPSLIDKYDYNQVNAFWEKGSPNIRFNGSTHFQGNVAHGLWELPQSQRTPAIYSYAQSLRKCAKIAYGCA